MERNRINGIWKRLACWSVMGLMCAGMMGCYTDPPAIQEQRARQEHTRELRRSREKIDSLLAKDQFREAEELAKVSGEPESMFRRSQLDLAREGVQALNAGSATTDNVLDRMNVREDKVDNNRWYSAKINSLRYQLEGHDLFAKVTVYMGQKIDQPDNVWLRWNAAWHGSRWAFMHDLTVVADGKRFEWSNLEFKRDYETTSFMSIHRVEVTESIDSGISDKERQMLEAVIHARDAVLRFRGNRHNFDYTFTEMDRLLFQDMLTLCDKFRASR